MAIAAGKSMSAEAVRERIAPAYEAFEDFVRKGHHAFDEGRIAAEDARVTATRRIKKHPLRAVAYAAGAGALAGMVLAFGIVACRTRGPDDTADCV